MKSILLKGKKLHCKRCQYTFRDFSRCGILHPLTRGMNGSQRRGSGFQSYGEGLQA